MELLSPAGDAAKLRIAYLYGADAAYIGVPGFSLRAAADAAADPGAEAEEGANGTMEGLAAVAAIKAAFPGRRLYGALNIFCYDSDIRSIAEWAAAYADLPPEAAPYDALIVSDPGALRVLRRTLPAIELHLSTQANCLNAESARFYAEAGVRRIVPGRELSLRQIEELKRTVPELELEVFVHGAMCWAYSGRCFLSRGMIDRSANRGDCAHSCRWDYRIEEAKRPGEFLPVVAGSDFTAVFSSKDLCMIDHIEELRTIGVDSIKIEGRMKSLYYTALVTRAYRHVLDTGESRRSPYRADLDSFSHREYCTGFYFGSHEVNEPAATMYRQQHQFLGIVTESLGNRRYAIDVRNSFAVGEQIEYVGPKLPVAADCAFSLYSPDGTPSTRAVHQLPWVIETIEPLEPGFLLRRAVADRTE